MAYKRLTINAKKMGFQIAFKIGTICPDFGWMLKLNWPLFS